MKMLDRVKYILNLIRLLFKYSKLIFLCPIFSILAAFAELIAMVVIVPLSELATSGKLNSNDYVLKVFVNFGVPPTMKNLFSCMVIFLIIRLVALSINQGFTVFISKKFHAYLSATAFYNIINFTTLSEVRKKSIGHYMALAGDEAFKVSEILVSINKLFSIILLGGLYFLAIFYLSPSCSLFLILFLIISGALMTKAFKLSGKLGELKFEQSKKANSIFIDALNGLATVRSFSAEKYITKQYSNNISAYTNTLFKIDYFNILIKFIPIATVLLVFSIFLLSSYSYVIESNKINFPIFITLTLFIMRFLPVVGQLINIYIQIISDTKASQDISEALNISDLVSHKNTVSFDKCVHSISFDNVSYGYNKKDLILNNFNYTFFKGKSYALIGASGIGKSTLLKLLIGLIPLSSGDIKINKCSINTLSLSLLRRKIIYLEQDTVILNDTIKNNLLFGSANVEKQIYDAIIAAQCVEFIETFPDGYEHKVSYQGSNLSGGQKQRIGLARAIIRNPDVLLLDEATSALDLKTKDRVIRNILDLYKNKIVIFVSHDPDIRNYVDEVIDFEKNNKSDFSIIQELNINA